MPLRLRSRSRRRRSCSCDNRRERLRDDSNRVEDAKAEDAMADDYVDDGIFRPERQVVIRGLKSNPEKNGAIGTLIKFNEDKMRWVVELLTGNVNLKEDNLELMPDNSDVVNEKEKPPTAKIYITNLARDVEEKDLLELFGSCGVIAKKRGESSQSHSSQGQCPHAIKLYKPGLDGGDACVEFQDPLAAKAAIKTYNRYKWRGFRIGVIYAGQGKTYEKVELKKPYYARIGLDIPDRPSLIETIKNFQKGSDQQKNIWYKFLEGRSFNSKDPVRHETSILQEFVNKYVDTRRYGLPSEAEPDD